MLESAGDENPTDEDKEEDKDENMDEDAPSVLSSQSASASRFQVHLGIYHLRSILFILNYTTLYLFLYMPLVPQLLTGFF